jgi:hypothetical protein
MLPYVPPKFQEKASCPWERTDSILNQGYPLVVDKTLDNVYFCICRHCKGYTIWVDEKMIYPKINGVSFPYPDMPQDVKEVYEEAVTVSACCTRATITVIITVTANTNSS